MLLVDMPNLSTGNGTANTSICGTIEEPHHDLHLVQPFVLSQQRLLFSTGVQSIILVLR